MNWNEYDDKTEEKITFSETLTWEQCSNYNESIMLVYAKSGDVPAMTE